MKRNGMTLLALYCWAMVECLPAGDWMQWRGPQLNGAADETGLPTTWSASENIAWKLALPGEAGSTPIVVGNHIFLTSTVLAENRLAVMAVDLETGNLLWSHDAGEDQSKRKYHMASPSPVSDGKHVYFLFGTGRLIAMDFAGKQLWQRELEKEYGTFSIQFGYAGSPLLFRDKLYFVLYRNIKPSRWGPSTSKGPLDNFLLAIDPVTGKTLWKQVIDTDADDESREGYFTPIPYEGHGQADIICTGGEFVTGHNPQTGEENWRWEYSPHQRRTWQRIVTTPLCHGDLLYVIRPKNQTFYALNPGKNGQGRLNDDIIVWRTDECTADVPSPLFYRDRLYIVGESKKVISCLNPQSGELIWREKLGGKAVFWASPTGADGKIYCISLNGEVVVLQAGDELNVLSRIPMGERPCYSTIVAAHDRLLIRMSKSLVCVKQESQGPEK